jgi:hypothetical protein
VTGLISSVEGDDGVDVAAVAHVLVALADLVSEGVAGADEFVELRVALAAEVGHGGNVPGLA